MKRMIPALFFILLTGAGFEGSCLYAQSRDLNAALKELTQFEYGDDIACLNTIETSILESHNRPELRNHVEKQLLTILEANSPIAAQTHACRFLSLVGSESSIPVLVNKLGNKRLAHMARFALERIGGSTTRQSLRKALGQAEGSARIEIITALWNLRDEMALSVLGGLLRSPDLETVNAVLVALGKIGTHEAAQQLTAFSPQDQPTVTPVLEDARLQAAQTLADQGQYQMARELYKDLYQHGSRTSIRTAGLRGLLILEPSKTQERILQALAGNDSKQRGLGARILTELPPGSNVEGFIRAYSSLPNEGKVALIGALAIRGESAAKPVVRTATQDPSPRVRLAAWRALAFIGDSGDILRLAETAAADRHSESESANQSLINLRGPKIDEAMAKALPSVATETRIVLINALVARMALGHASDIAAFLSDRDETVCIAAIKALDILGDHQQLSALIDRLHQVEDAQERRNLEQAIKAICNRHPQQSTPKILEAFPKSDGPPYIFLLKTLSVLGGQAALDRVLTDLQAANTRIQVAAVRTLATWPEDTARAPLLKLINSSPSLAHQVVAFRGYTRLLRSADLPDEDKTKALGNAMRLAKRREEKLIVLAALGEIKSLHALKRAERKIYDPELSNAACTAVLNILAELETTDPLDTVVALEQVLRVSKNPQTLEKAQEILLERKLSRINNPDPSKRTGKRIILVAGPMDHAGPGAHEYPKDLVLIKHCLDRARNISGFTTEIYFGELPQDLSLLEGAATLVIHSSADRAQGETHSLFPSFDEDYDSESKVFYDGLDKLFKKGLGLVVLHYAVWTDKESSRRYMLDWVGGYHRKGQSRVKKVTSQVQPAVTEHPILNGVLPWTTMEEYYFQQYLQRDQRLTPILETSSLSNPSELDVVAWAVERQGGGRGFAFTGCHYHDSLKIEDYRQVVLNAICWSSGLPIPSEGILVDIE